ncbi:MAG: PspA/IM30 family protein [Pseudomonadota bacterium]
MSEGLMSRVQRLVTGSVSDFVDTIENAAPETVMRESIREIDRAADDVRHELGRAIADRHNANRRLMEATSKHEDLAEKARFALEQGRDDLAKAAIARQLDMEAQIPILAASLKEVAAEQVELEGYVSALLARRREMEADLETYLESRATVSGDGSEDAGPAKLQKLSAEKKATKAESAFNRVLKSASGLAATSPADTETAAKLAELESVTRDHRVEERLAALKAIRD